MYYLSFRFSLYFFIYDVGQSNRWIYTYTEVLIEWFSIELQGASARIYTKHLATVKLMIVTTVIAAMAKQVVSLLSKFERYGLVGL